VTINYRNKVEVQVKGRRLRSAPTHLDWVVTVDGADLVIGAGTFTIGKTEYVLAEQQEYTIVNRAEVAEVSAFLAVEKATDTTVVIVDEFVHDGADIALQWGRGGPYLFLTKIYTAVVPAGSTGWDAVTVDVRNRIAEGAER